MDLLKLPKGKKQLAVHIVTSLLGSSPFFNHCDMQHVISHVICSMSHVTSCGKTTWINTATSAVRPCGLSALRIIQKPGERIMLPGAFQFLRDQYLAFYHTSQLFFHAKVNCDTSVPPERVPAYEVIFTHDLLSFF